MIKASRLPKEYTEVEYIQNSGTQYIDTEFIPNYDKSIKIEIVTTPTVAGRRYCLMSNYSASNHLSLELNTSNKGRLYWNNSQVDKTLGTMSTSDKNTFIFEYDATNKQYNFTVNDETANGNMNATGVSGNSLLIFVDQMKRFSTFANPLRIYSVKITENDILVRNLVPCVRKSDDEVGMYDLANGIFLTNAGTGTFTAGNKVQVKVKKIKIKINETMKEIEQIKTKVNSTMAKVFNVLSTIIGTGTNITLQNTANLEFVQPPLPRGNSEQATSILPTGYTQLDYIESTGTQYINTGITADNTVEFDVTFNTSDNLSNSTYGAIFGSRQASVTNELQVTTYSDSGFQGTFRYGTGGNYNAYLTRLQKINVKLENNKYYVDDVEKLTMDREFTNNYNIYIFALNNGGTAAQYGKLKLYKFKLWKNGSLVRNYVPCKNASNEVGLYDLVSETFFGNSGTGTFTAGDVSTLPTPEYLIPITNVTGDVEVLVQNKNKLKLDIATDTKGLTVTKNEDGTITLNGTTSYGGVIYISEEFTTIANQDYTISSHVKSGTTTDNPHTTFWNSVASAWFFDVSVGTSQTKQYSSPVTQKFAIYVNANKTYTNYTIDIQLEEGTTASTYTPHQEQTFIFPLGTQRLMLGDYLADDGIHHVRKQVVLDGSEDESYNIELKTGYSILKITIDDMVTTNNGIGLSSHFTKYSYHNAVIGAISFGWINKVVYMYMPDTITSVTDFRTWLSTHNVTLEYVLATEEITTYTSEQQTAYNEIKQATSYGEQTNISGTSDEANPIFSVEAYQRN